MAKFYILQQLAPLPPHPGAIYLINFFVVVFSVGDWMERPVLAAFDTGTSLISMPTGLEFGEGWTGSTLDALVQSDHSFLRLCGVYVLLVEPDFFFTSVVFFFFFVLGFLQSWWVCAGVAIGAMNTVTTLLYRSNKFYFTTWGPLNLSNIQLEIMKTRLLEPIQRLDGQFMTPYPTA